MTRERPTVLVTQRLPDPVEARIARDFQRVPAPQDRALSADEIAEASQPAKAVVCTVADRFGAELIARLGTQVAVIASFSVGVDHVDLDAARRRGMRVTNTPDVVTVATSEIALLLLLAASRRAGEGDRLVRSGNWTGAAPTQLLGHSLEGKRLGIVGMGRIGRAFADRARPLGVEIHYADRSRLPADTERGAVFHPTLEELLSVSQLLSLHAPSTPENRHLLDARRIALLPRGAVVVNTARGDLVDDEALVAAIRSGQVGAVGLDVYEGEPRVHPGYREAQNAFLLPHMGTSTHETRDAMGFRALDNVDAVLAGREPRDPVV